MRLKNRKTGEVIQTQEIYENCVGKIKIRKDCEEFDSQDCEYDSMSKLFGEWEEIDGKEMVHGERVPKRFDRYWYIDAEGDIQSAVWGNIDIHLTSADEKRFECGSAFWTEEEALKELERRKAMVRLKNDGFRFSGFKVNYVGFARDVMNPFTIGFNKRMDEDWIKKHAEDLQLAFGGNNAS